MTIVELVKIHLNVSGVPNTWFVQNFKKLSPSNQALVNSELVKIGHEPYRIKGSIGNKKVGKRGRPARATRVVQQQPKVLTDQEKEQEAALVRAIQEIRIDREILQEHVVGLNKAEDMANKQLCELRGVPFNESVTDPYRAYYSRARAASRHNKAALESSEKCGCMFCRAVFDPKAISVYVENDTAMCPNCGMTAIVCGDLPISTEFLLSMFRRWYAVPLRIQSGRARRLEKSEEAEALPPPAPLPALPPPPPVLPETKLSAPIDDTVQLSGIGSKLADSVVDEDEDE